MLSLRFGSLTKLSRFTATAFGIHELTGVPTDVDRDRSFVLVVGTSFRPGIPLGYGIRIIGIGGIVGIDRRADTDALRERLTSGAVGNILFAEDPVRNAPILLGDLAALFPVKRGYNVLGLTVQLGWLPQKAEYLVRLAIGVIVELDSSNSPTKAILLGSLNISVPGHEGFLDVKVDAIGVLDFQRQTLEIDATIRRGVVMGLFKISGDGGVRSSWGDTPYLMATLGGFHPKFHPEPAVFPKLNRILITVDKSTPAGRRRAQRVGLHGRDLEHDPVRRELHRLHQVRQLEDRGLHRRRRTDPPAVRVRRGDQGRRAREVPRAQPDRRQLQGRPRRARPARPSGRGVHLVAPVRRLLARQLPARWRRHLRPGWSRASCPSSPTR